MSWEDVLKQQSPKTPDLLPHHEEPKNFFRHSDVTWEDMREDSANALRSAKTIREKLQGISIWLSEVSHSLDKTVETRDFREITEQRKDVNALMEIVDEMAEETEKLVDGVEEMGE